MPQGSRAPEHPDVSAEQRLANELVKRIRKLRWIGMNEEARALAHELHRGSDSDSVVARSYETD
jgi:hypothetical protein